MAVGRSDSLQELITVLETMFGETIIGTDINLVKHLFYFLKADDVEFPFDYDGQRFFAVVENIEETNVYLRIPGATQGLTLRAKISFEIMNILYQFEVVILEFLEEGIRIRIPSELQAASFRKNVRVAVDDLFMNYVILFRSLSGGGREIGRNIQVEQRFNSLMREIKKDNPDLRLINIMISEYISTVSKDYEIVFFSGSKEESFLESFMRRHDRPVYIPDTSLIVNYIREQDSSWMTNYRAEYIRMVLENGQDYADKFFRELQKTEIRDFIISYLILPIRLFNDVVGYIRVHTSAMDRYSITPSQAGYLIELSDIFNYSITKIFIREDNYRHTKAATRVVDISINGLLFEINEKRIFQYLKKHNIIKIFIPVAERTLVMRGEVVRYIAGEEGKFLLGVNFFDSNPDDMLILQKYIFLKTRRVLSE
ncbi:PilZ domain-containing protein [Leptospira gomenensis]|uniref:PilZ domain-containing protein n=1 Tax=Leptospira gomenensis TaxID=2484974 RepID=A0A5F1Y7H3_9LEPT|nr:PilZ domain-containing protein [Leptospira gomenensis]TGK29493.1 PilZ domain-containing protein [Leptospira gomenensis]TGK33891.1 PilZ domain-containing protein [Leptospira gomenensis]TGK44845.1 PilZ domain-containing protein [Leptospira gomenensis]TGK64464.1 PilZ domain-containing protein [Leptospira gomenensis]